MNAMVLLGFLLGFAADPRGAPSADEERLFAEGLRAFNAGDAPGAAQAWKQGYELRHDPAFLVRIGEAQEKAGAPPAAAESYRRYLREAPDASDRADIEQRLARLNPGINPPSAPAAIPAPAAETAAPAPAPAAKAGPPRAVTPAVDNDDRHAAAGNGNEPSGWTPIKATAWIGVAATVALLGTAAFFAVSAASKKDDVNRLITYRDPDTAAPLPYQMVAAQYESAMSDGRHDDRVAKISLLAAAGTAAVATTFFIIDGVRGQTGGLALAPTQHGGLALVGSWQWRF
jgi:hypothetical protein